MAKLSLSLFKLILFYECMINLKNDSYIIHYIIKIMSHLTLVDTKDVTINSWGDKILSIQILSHSSELFLRNVQLQNICILITKCKTMKL